MNESLPNFSRAFLQQFQGLQKRIFSFSSRCVQPMAHRLHAAQHKIVNLLKIFFFLFCSSVFVIVCVFNVCPKTSLLLPVWSRDTKRLDTPVAYMVLFGKSINLKLRLFPKTPWEKKLPGKIWLQEFTVAYLTTETQLLHFLTPTFELLHKTFICVEYVCPSVYLAISYPFNTQLKYISQKS